MLGIHPNTAVLFYRKIRQVIAFSHAKEAYEIFQCDIEINESYFGGIRKNKCGRDVARKVVVFGILMHHNKVYTVVVENTKTKILMNEIAL